MTHPGTALTLLAAMVLSGCALPKREGSPWLAGMATGKEYSNTQVDLGRMTEK